MNLLNNYFAFQADAVQAHLGVTDKFIGNSVMAFWGPPFIDESNHAFSSPSVTEIRVAVRPLRILETLNIEPHLAASAATKRKYASIDARGVDDSPIGDGPDFELRLLQSVDVVALTI